MTLKATKTTAFFTGLVTVFLLFLVENMVAPVGGDYPLGPAHLILVIAFLTSVTLFVFGVETLGKSFQQFRDQGLFPNWNDQMALMRDILPRFVMLVLGGVAMQGALKLYFMFGLN